MNELTDIPDLCYLDTEPSVTREEEIKSPLPLVNHSIKGFSLVEMMVVVSILLMAFGLMVPSLTEFFRNRTLDTVVSEMQSTLYTARMQAVVSGRPYTVVFFQEGLRIYDQKTKTWMADREFDAAKGETAHPTITYELYFAGTISEDLPLYDEWADANVPPQDPKDPEASKFAIKGLVGITFYRDGTLELKAGGSGGADFASANFRKEPPMGGDIVIKQRDNLYAAFVDLQPTGTVKSKVSKTTAFTSLKSGNRDSSEEGSED